MKDPRDPNFGADNKIVTPAEYEAALARLKELRERDKSDTRRLHWLSWPVVKSALGGLLLIAVVAWFGQRFIVDRYNAFRLSKDRAVATATITGVQMDVAENDDGSGGPYLIVTYSFVTPSGQTFEGGDHLGYSTTTDVGDSLPIQYLRTDPSVNGVEEAEPRGPATTLIVLILVCGCVICAIGYLCKVSFSAMREAARGTAAR